MGIGLSGEIVFVGADAEINVSDFMEDSQGGYTSLSQAWHPRPRTQTPIFFGHSQFGYLNWLMAPNPHMPQILSV